MQRSWVLPYSCWGTLEWFEAQEVMRLIGFKKLSACKEGVLLKDSTSLQSHKLLIFIIQIGKIVGGNSTHLIWWSLCQGGEIHLFKNKGHFLSSFVLLCDFLFFLVTLVSLIFYSSFLTMLSRIASKMSNRYAIWQKIMIKSICSHFQHSKINASNRSP